MLQKVQEVSLKNIDDAKFLQEQYEMLGFTVRRQTDRLVCFWGTPEKRAKREEKQEEPEHKPGQEKTARRLGRNK